MQTLASCGVCGRKAAVYYDGEQKATPGYYCTGGSAGASRGSWHLRVGGAAIDAAVTGAFLAALAPAALQACLTAAGQLEAGVRHRAGPAPPPGRAGRYQAAKAERRYRAVDPENRLVARGLETQWEHALQAQSDAEAELTRREKHAPPPSPHRARTGRDPCPRRYTNNSFTYPWIKARAHDRRDEDAGQNSLW